jgi:acyl-coenzyme A synthetase/AMP-(fatty) acid ligase
MNEIVFPEKYSAKSLINDDSLVIDLGLVTRDKQYLLNRTQYWKNLLRERNVKNIMLMQHMTIDSMAIVFACAEIGVTIYTSYIDIEQIKEKLDNVELIIYGNTYLMQFSKNLQEHVGNIPVMMLNEKETTKHMAQLDCQYVEEFMDMEHTLVVGESSGSTGAPKTIRHTVKTFVGSTKQAWPLFEPGDVFATLNGINHIGFLAITMLTPLMRGVKIFTVNYVHEILMFTTRSFLTKLVLYEHQLLFINSLPGFKVQPDCFNGITVITAGSLLSTRFVDMAFSYEAEKVISFYGNNEILGPAFILTMNSPMDPFDDGRLGVQAPGIDQTKIVDDQLWIKSDTISPSIKIDEEGFFNTGDYVARKDDQTVILGRKRFVTASGRKFFMKNIADKILEQLGPENNLYYSQFFLNYMGDNKIEIYAVDNQCYQLICANGVKIKEQLVALLEQLNLEMTAINSTFELGRYVGGKLTLQLVQSSAKDPVVF